MSENDEELELQALQRELDDAFATTRPRRGFDDELWARMQASRPAANRVRDALAGLWQGVRRMPVAPVAVVTLVALVLGLGVLSTVHRPSGGGAATSRQLSNGAGAPAPEDLANAAFGRLPSPVLDNGAKPTVGSTAQYAGPVRYVWAGKASLATATAPVYRYQEPTAGAADQFASNLGAVLRERTPGLLGSYSASTYTLNIRPTVDAPAGSPTYFIIASPSMPPIDAVGTPQEVATVFLAQHGLVPDWSYTVAVDSTADLVKVRFARQFGVAGYGEAYLVDGSGGRYGLEVDLRENRPILVAGMLPVSLDAAPYRLTPPDAAVMSVAGQDSSSVPTVQLTTVDLVYVLVPAGDHSFYEPAYLFSGKVQVGAAMYTRQLLVAAVDPSQRNP